MDQAAQPAPLTPSPSGADFVTRKPASRKYLPDNLPRHSQPGAFTFFALLIVLGVAAAVASVSGLPLAIRYVLPLGLAAIVIVQYLAHNRLARRYSLQLASETGHRMEAEQHLAALVESMPAAIVVVDDQGRIYLSNRAAEALFGVQRGKLDGQSIAPYIPNLAKIAGQNDGSDVHRTAANLQGQRSNGEHFKASAWFASCPAKDGAHLVAILADASEDLREFQETSLQTLLKSTRVLVGSVSHEIRNVCAAISIAQANLSRIPGVAESEDYAALRSLALSLARLSAAELPSPDAPDLTSVDLRGLLDEFRVVMGPALREESVQLSIEAMDELPLAVGDHHSLLQVLINLCRNSSRAMRRRKVKSILISVRPERGRVCIRVSDTGPGVKNPEHLFRAFQPGADSSGLGLFISRALVRSSGGDLSYEPGGQGCTMCIRLQHWAGDCLPELIHTSEIRS
jgi:PAS domain S-box-containing protein